MPARVPVTAVLVAHDGSRWLPEALSALAAQTVQPARVVAVDTGSADDSAALLRRATGHVLELPRSTSYSEAVRTAVDAVPADTRWVWLLHDDAAPDPDALSALLRAAAASPSAALLGPKAVDWDDPRVLREIGCSTDVFGLRDSGVEVGELDQGQHDGVREVLAVGTAGALVRRDVWDAVGGLDPELPLFRNDLDLGRRVNAAGHGVLVVPQARVRHAEAATVGERGDRHLAVDRRAAHYVQLAHGRLLPSLLLVLGLALVRALGALVTREPSAARAELAALLQVLARPAALARARRARAASRTVPRRALRPLLAPPLARLRTRAAAALDRGDRAVPTLDEPDPAGTQGLWRRPRLLLALALAAVALLACRDLLGGGALAGGRLLPAPDGAGALWTAYERHRDPAVAVLAGLGAVLAGSASLAVDLLLLLCVPLSGVVAAAVAGRVVRSTLLRVWAGAAWALLPVATGAVARGDLAAAAVHVVLPALLLAGHRLLRQDPRHDGWSGAWAVGLALTAVTALAPGLWPAAALLLIGTAAVRVSAAAAAQRATAVRRLAAAAVATAVPLLLLLPWAPRLLDAASLHGPGRVGPGLADLVLPAWHLLLLQPGGPGAPATGLTGGLLVAALGGLLRTRRVRVAAAGWGLALLGLALALVLARTTVAGQPVWPGVALDLAAAGMLLSALVGGEGLQGSLARAAFGWRQLAAVLAVVAAVAAPVAAAAAWVERGAGGPLERRDPDLLPAFVAAELARSGARALVVDERPDGTYAYAVVGADGARLGDEPVEVDAVAELLTPGTDAAAGIAAAGVAFVAAPRDVAALDAQPGLAREASDVPLWRVVPAAADVRGERAGGLPVALQAVALLVVAVLAVPARRPRRGLVRR